MQVENSLIFSPRNQHYIPSRVPEGYTSGNTWDPWLVGEEGRESKKKGEMPLCVSTYKLFFFLTYKLLFAKFPSLDPPSTPIQFKEH